MEDQLPREDMNSSQVPDQQRHKRTVLFTQLPRTMHTTQAGGGTEPWLVLWCILNVPIAKSETLESVFFELLLVVTD